MTHKNKKSPFAIYRALRTIWNLRQNCIGELVIDIYIFHLDIYCAKE